MNKSDSGSCTSLKVTEAIARYGKGQGDQVARHPCFLNRGEPTSRKTTERLARNPHKWKLPFQPEENKPTLRKQDSASRDLGSRTRKRKVSRSPCFPKSEGRHHRWNGKLAYERRSGTTKTTVPMTRHGENLCRVRPSKKIAKLDSFN